MESEAEIVGADERQQSQFKKPILVGKIGRLPKKLIPTSVETRQEPTETPTERQEEQPAPTQNTVDSPLLPYKEPNWSGLPTSPNTNYMFEVLKNGAIIETIDLMLKPFWVFGRLPNCDIPMQHPTISRYHAVLQYKQEINDDNKAVGFYIYDLGSTHGTFLNKNRIKPQIYTRIQVGHILKLGCSSRSYILNGPIEDAEDESTFTITELQQLRQEELQKRQQQQLEEQRKHDENERELCEKGIDWGLGEDADEDTDLTENPYAQTTNEDLYLDNPKRTLRGFFEREGLDLNYDCSEYGVGQFQCKIELPIDDDTGRPVYAEIVHKGKKKDAVTQCALEACRILDRHGVLRQSQHESRRRKRKNWEDNDYYDSDDDTFLDRTGTVEKKREMRMKAKLPQKVETYESLVDKEKNLQSSITTLEKQLDNIHSKLAKDRQQDPDQDDSLDSYMMELKDSKPDKIVINKIKTELVQLRKEHTNIVQLVNLTRPTSLPALVTTTQHTDAEPNTAKSKGLPIFGKRRKVKIDYPKKNTEITSHVNDSRDDDGGEEVEVEEDNE